MNERIKQLAIEADIMAPTWNHVPLGYQKFAELIVQECLYIVEGEDDGSADTKSVRLAMLRMKKHFGVEE
jgi:hypothetical protein